MITHRKGQKPGLSSLAPIKPRGKQGRARMKQIEEAAKNAHRDAMIARARSLGLPATREVLDDMRSQWWGCNAGSAMAKATDAKDRPALWDAIQHIRRVVTTYDREIGAPARHAKCLRLLSPTDAMEADASSPALDDRDDDTRMRHAVAAYNTLLSWVAPLPMWTWAHAASCILDDAPCRDASGLLMVLHAVGDGISGRN